MTCPDCNAVMRGKSDLNWHRQNDHAPRVFFLPKMVCNKCGYRKTGKRSLVVEWERAFCDICNVEQAVTSYKNFSDHVN